MLRVDEQIALIDFGLAKHAALALEITDTGLIFGTPHYMSPEQGHGQELDPRSDLYSLGVMLYEMLTGRKPYTADNPMAIIYMHRNAPLPRLPEELADLQPLLDRLLGKRPRGSLHQRRRRPCRRSKPRAPPGSSTRQLFEAEAGTAPSADSCRARARRRARCGVRGAPSSSSSCTAGRCV